MEDAVRPSQQAFKEMYEKAYRTWFGLCEMTIQDGEAYVPWWHCLFQLEHGFPNHPSFPDNLAINASFSNTIIVTGISTWKTAQRFSDLASFDQELVIQVASDCPTTLVIADAQQPILPKFFNKDNNHITLLILAWAYILSARWAEIIPGASGPEYSDFEAEWAEKEVLLGNSQTNPTKSIIDLGHIDDEAARWWAAVLALEGGWSVSIQSDKGHILYSPWQTKLVSDQKFTLTRHKNCRPISTQHHAASFTTALQYLSQYCEFHGVVEQGHAALAATLLFPAAKFDDRRIQLPIPRLRYKTHLNNETNFKPQVWSENLEQLNRLLTLSCNAIGTKALLTSVFFELGVPCNLCGAWLQGAFAFLDSVKDQHTLLRILMKRDPSLGFLWLGAFIIGAHTRALKEGRQAWWKIDLHVAAWTGTFMSFIQEPVSNLLSEAKEISRADECRLMYLSHDQYYTVPPLFPFAPFGSTVVTDTSINVRLHTKCQTKHSLEYESFTWRCLAGHQANTTFSRLPLRNKNGQSTDRNVFVNYDNLDNEDDESSEMVTRNIFTWLRDEDGFPVAERAIREHEWIDNLNSDDDDECLIAADSQSTANVDLHGWLLKTVTKRANSI